jgi:putative FmdB family regulatory protein
MSPLYEFYCERCGKHIERIVPSRDRDKVRCDECGPIPHRLIRVWSAFNWTFGWVLDNIAKFKPDVPTRNL